MEFSELVQLGRTKTVRTAEVILVKIMRQWQAGCLHTLQKLLLFSALHLRIKDSQQKIVIAGRVFLSLQKDIGDIRHKTTQAESLCTGSDSRNFFP